MLDKYDSSNTHLIFYSIVECKNSWNVVYVNNATENIQYIPFSIILVSLGRNIKATYCVLGTLYRLNIRDWHAS